MRVSVGALDLAQASRQGSIYHRSLAQLLDLIPEEAMAEEKDATALLQHQLGTYRTLRVVLAGIGFALPFVVAIAGWLQCQNPPQLIAGSLSAYYHRTALHEFLTARDLFVGGLLAAAACLYAYKGFSTKENVALNLAAVFALGVALFPTAHDIAARDATKASASCVVFMGNGFADPSIRPTLHAISAILFFFCLAYVSIWRCRDTLRLLPNEAKRARYNRGYVLTGLAMAATPVTALLVTKIADAPHPIFVFAMEAIGVWAFCAYWAIKSREMKETDMDSRVAGKEVERAAVASQPPAKPLDRAIRQLQVGGAKHVERIVPVESESIPAAVAVLPDSRVGEGVP